MLVVIDTEKPTEKPIPLTQHRIRLHDANQVLEQDLEQTRKKVHDLEDTMRAIAQRLGMFQPHFSNHDVIREIDSLKKRQFTLSEKTRLEDEVKRLKGVLQSLHKMTKFSAE